MTPRSCFPADDLRTAVRWALEREGPLFRAGERVVLARVLALTDDAAELYARLTLRVGRCFAVGALRYACARDGVLDELVAAELVDGAVAERERFAAFGAETLREACRRLGLRHTGPRTALEARLAGLPWCTERVIGVHHHALLRRAERLGGFDRALAPAERIAGTRWAEYTPTPGPGAFAMRRDLWVGERARAGELDPDEVLALARRGPPAWGRSPFRYAAEALVASRPAADALAGIVGLGVEHVRALEAEVRLREALARCRQGDPEPEVAIALARTGRRLAKKLREPWPPGVPLAEPRQRRLWLPRVGTGPDGRPAWSTAGTPEGAPIERAVLQRVLDAGRTALHAENWLWASLFALVFRELYWVPLPGRLPTARRSGPADLGTPSFYRARESAAEAILARLRAEGLAPFSAAWSGERLDGLVRAELTVEVGARIGGPTLAAVLGPILRRGWSAVRGLPDFVVLAGPAVRLGEAIPQTLPECTFFAELKGPTDQVRDAQRWWHDSLVKSGELVELWHVSESTMM